MLQVSLFLSKQLPRLSFCFIFLFFTCTMLNILLTPLLPPIYLSSLSLLNLSMFVLFLWRWWAFSVIGCKCKCFASMISFFCLSSLTASKNPPFLPPSRFPFLSLFVWQTAVTVTLNSPWCVTNLRVLNSSKPRRSSPGRSCSRFTEALRM